MGIEPMTSSLPRKHSTPELHRLFSESTYKVFHLIETKKKTRLYVSLATQKDFKPYQSSKASSYIDSSEIF